VEGLGRGAGSGVEVVVDGVVDGVEVVVVVDGVSLSSPAVGEDLPALELKAVTGLSC